MLHLFAPEAFDHPVTRLIVTFTGGSASDSPKQIRIYVADALKQISQAASDKGARCPDGELGRQLISPGIQPDNDPGADGFALLTINHRALNVLAAEADPAEPQLSWIKGRVGDGHKLVSMSLACNHVPIALLWERQPSGKWFIIGFAVTGD